MSERNVEAGERPFRIGLIGASRVATFAVIAPARKLAGIVVEGVAARDARKAESYAREHGISRAFASYSELLASPDIDLVYLGTPPALHAEQAKAAIAAGKPVLVEKPFALTAAEAADVLALSRSTGVRVFEAMHSPHHAIFGRLLQVLDAGEIGAPVRIEALFETKIDRGDPFRWNAADGGGALMDLGVYPLAWVRRITGEDFAINEAEAVFEGGVDASFEAELSFPDGLTARISASMTAPQAAARLTVVGTRGRIELNNPLAPQIGHALRVETAGGVRSETRDGPGTFEEQLAAVRRAVQDGADFPFPDDDYVHSMRALERVRQAFP